MKIRKGDTVQIRGGKDSGKSGKVLAVDTKAATVLVEGLNTWKRHRKPRKQGEKGEVIALPRPLSIGNVSFVCSRCGKAVRVGFVVSEKGDKRRVCKSCGGAL